MDLSLLLALLAGIAIAAAAGLRAFLPLLLLGLAARFGWIELKIGVSWLTSDHALWALGIATLLEIAGDKIPVVDHALDAVGTVLRPAAAWLGAYAVLANWPTPWAQIAALVLGAGALGLHLLKSGIRLGSTASTAGTANPVLSTAEDGLSLIATLLAVLVPLLALVVVAALLWAIVSRKRVAPPQGPASSPAPSQAPS